MTTKSHKTLTGNQLHEPKGIDAASDDTVATSTTNSIVWKKLTASNLTGTGNSFGGQLFHIRNEQVSGTAPESIGLGAWTAVTLNTSKTNEISGASLATNQITLPAGTYFIEALQEITNNTTSKASIRLQNITDSTTTIVGTSTSFNTSALFTNLSARGRFTIAGTKVFELQLISSNSFIYTGYTASLQTEVFSEVFIWKIA